MQSDSTQIEVIDEDASRWLATIETADRALAEAVAHSDLPRLVAIRDQAAALQHLADQQRYAAQWQRHAAAIKLRSERAVGEILADLARAKAGRPKNSGNVATINSESEDGDWEPDSQVEPDAPPLSPYRQAIEDLGLDIRTANRWQTEAALSERGFERFMEENEEPTSSALEQAARKATAPPPRPRIIDKAPIANRMDVAQVLAILDELVEYDPERVGEVKRIVRLIAKAAGLA